MSAPRLQKPLETFEQLAESKEYELVLWEGTNQWSIVHDSISPTMMKVAAKHKSQNIWFADMASIPNPTNKEREYLRQNPTHVMLTDTFVDHRFEVGTRTAWESSKLQYQ
jgi:hypothetical protein